MITELNEQFHRTTDNSKTNDTVTHQVPLKRKSSSPGDMRR